MTTREERTLARARELDDPYPDNICPGCQNDITGWENWLAHHKDWSANSRGRFFVGSKGYTESDWCPWDSDYLSARSVRRWLIACAA